VSVWPQAGAVEGAGLLTWVEYGQMECQSTWNRGEPLAIFFSCPRSHLLAFESTTWMTLCQPSSVGRLCALCWFSQNFDTRLALFVVVDWNLLTLLNLPGAAEWSDALDLIDLSTSNTILPPLLLHTVFQSVIQHAATAVVL